MSENQSGELRQLWAAVRHAQRLSDKIRRKMLDGMPSEETEKDEGIAVVPIKEADLVTKRHLIRRTAR